MLTNLTWVDIVIAAIFLFSIFAGFVRGFLKEVCILLCWIVAYLVATKFALPLAAKVASTSTLAVTISFFAIFALTLMVCSIFTHFATGLTNVVAGGLINRLLGAIFGFLRGCLVVLILIFITQATPLVSDPAWQKARFVPPFQPYVERLKTWINPEYQNLKSRFSNISREIFSR